MDFREDPGCKVLEEREVRLMASQSSRIESIPALDIMSAFEQEPPALDFVIPGLLAGTIGTVYSPGGGGKSWLALQAGLSISSSVAGADLLGLSPAHHGPVVYFAAEDPASVLRWRLHEVGRRVGPEARSSVAENFTLVPLVGKMINLLEDKERTGLIARCEGARLILLDTISRFHRLDENSNSDMAVFVSALENIAQETKAAVLYLHHANKQAARDEQADQQQAARGASCLIDNARWAGFVAKMTTREADRFSVPEEFRSRYLRFGVSKQNYALCPPDRWYERTEGGVLVPSDFSGHARGKFRD